MIQPLLKTDAKTAARAAVFQTQRRATDIRSSDTPLSLDTGTPEDLHDHNTRLSNDLRRAHPVSKPLDTGSLDECHKPNTWNKLRRAHPVSKVGQWKPLNMARNTWAGRIDRLSKRGELLVNYARQQTRSHSDSCWL